MQRFMSLENWILARPRYDGPSTPRRLRHLAFLCGFLALTVLLLLIASLTFGGSSFGVSLLSPKATPSPVETPKPPPPKFYDWSTRSQFAPVKQEVANKSIEELCESFPRDLLHDVQPILKTGHGVLNTRLKTQLQSTAACLDHNLLIFSDLDEEYDDIQVIDILVDLPKEFGNRSNEQLESYYTQKELADNGTLDTPAAPKVEGWPTDKFKFLPQVSRAWRMRPNKRWYVFFEDDTYIVWDNLFRLLINLDPDKPWYMGSPSPGARGFWMAYGGPGYVLSREAVRRLIKDDYDEDGAFSHSALSQRWEEQMMLDCCGDSILGLAVHEDAQTNISGLFPMFQPHPLHGVPLGEHYWCQPVISMHKSHPQDMVALRRWEESRRMMRRPLLFADLVEFLNLTKVASHEDWTNTDFGGYAPPDEGAHASFDACGKSCKSDRNCLQWTYHLRTCGFVSSIRLGQAKSPGIEKDRSGEEKAMPWTAEEKRYMAGWDLEGIKRYMQAPGRNCEKIEWVRPSVKRIF